jgi:SpoVK/Ycf46/Vps4 family AAA+-type ATPase
VELPDYESSDKDMYNALARAQEECRRMAEAYKELNTRFLDTQKKLNVALLDQKMYQDRYNQLQEQIKTERAAGNRVVDALSQQLAEMCDGVSGAEIKNICTEAGMMAIRDDRDTIEQKDFNVAKDKVLKNRKSSGPPVPANLYG